MLTLFGYFARELNYKLQDNERYLICTAKIDVAIHMKHILSGAEKLQLQIQSIQNLIYNYNAEALYAGLLWSLQIDCFYP